MTSESSVASVAADSNVLLSAVAGHAAQRVFATEVRVLTTASNVDEVWEYLPRMARRYGILERVLREALALLPVEIVPETEYRHALEEATGYLGDRDPDDVPLAALALSFQIPIWSNDRDFEDMPLPVYTTARLLKALGL